MFSVLSVFDSMAPKKKVSLKPGIAVTFIAENYGNIPVALPSKNGHVLQI